MKTLRLINTLGLAAIAMLATTSCESGNQEFDYEGQTSVYYSKPAYVRTVELGEDQEVDLTEDNQHYINIMAFCGGGYTNGNDVTVDYVIDPTLVEGKSMVYNDKERAMTVMPQEYYTVENANQFVISKGNLKGGPNPSHRCFLCRPQELGCELCDSRQVDKGRRCGQDLGRPELYSLCR